jgi:hypothetical protein
MKQINQMQGQPGGASYHSLFTIYYLLFAIRYSPFTIHD